MFVSLLFLIHIVIARKHKYIKHVSLSEVNIKGQLITFLGYPLGASLTVQLQINGQQKTLVTDLSGEFAVTYSLTTGQSVSGSLIVNVADQFEQKFPITGQINKGEVDLGYLKIDNHLQELTHISGKVYSADTQQPLKQALVTLNFSKPIWLDLVNITTQDSGSFDSSINLMKLLVYGVNVKIEMQGYVPWDCNQDLPSICQKNQGIALYNQYIYAFPNLSIQLKPDYISVGVSVKVVSLATGLPVSGIQVTVLCQAGDTGTVFVPQVSNSLGVAQLKSSSFRRYDQFFCAIWTYTSLIKSEVFMIVSPLFHWDGTINQDLFIRV